MLAKFMYRQSIWKIPEPLQNVFIMHGNVHDHNTRMKLNPTRGEYIGKLTENSFVVRGPRLCHSYLQILKIVIP